MLLKIYELILERNIRKVSKIPKHIMIITPKLEERFHSFLEWCRKFGIKEVTVCTNYQPKIEVKNAKVNIVKDGCIETFGDGDLTLNIVVGYKGRTEIVNTIKKIGEKVLRDEMKIEDINEETFDMHLSLRSQPDIIVKAGREVPEFMIWQSIYSEYYFADIDWGAVRYVDFLRILREYQGRERRLGR